MALATFMPGFAHAQDDVDLRQVFERILQDPENPGLNLRYARLANDRGDIRKALAAYERVLAQDPNNEQPAPNTPLAVTPPPPPPPPITRSFPPIVTGSGTVPPGLDRGGALPPGLVDRCSPSPCGSPGKGKK